MDKELLKLLKKKEILYLLQDLEKANRNKEDIKISITLKKGNITNKEYTIRKNHI